MGVCRILLFAAVFGSALYSSLVDGAFTPSFLACLRTGTERYTAGISNLATSGDAAFLPLQALLEEPNSILADCSQIRSGDQIAADTVEVKSSEIFEQLLKDFTLSLGETAETRDLFDEVATPFIDEISKLTGYALGGPIKGCYKSIESDEILNVQFDGSHYDLLSGKHCNGMQSNDVFVSSIRTFEYDATSEVSA